MVKSINVGGASDDLPPEMKRYEDAFTTAGEVMQHALDIFNDPDFDCKSSWKLSCQSKDVTVHYKDFKLGRYFAGRCKVNISAKDLASDFWNNIDTNSEWNDNIKFAKRHTQITPLVDIVSYITNDIMMVKSREFVSARCLREIDGSFILAGRSISLPKEIPEKKGAVRGVLHVGLGRTTPDHEDPEHSCFYDYVLCMDLKGMMFKSAVNQVMGRSTLKDIELVRQHAQNVIRKQLYPGL